MMMRASASTRKWLGAGLLAFLYIDLCTLWSLIILTGNPIVGVVGMIVTSFLAVLSAKSLYSYPNVKKLQKKHDVKGLVKALYYGYERQAAVIALTELGDAQAVEPLLAIVKECPKRLSYLT